MTSSLNWIDVLILVSIAYLAFKGYRRGLIRQAVSLGGLILGILFSSKLSTYVEPWMVKIIDLEPRIARVISYTITFIIILWITNLLSKVVHKSIHHTPLAFFNKILGTVLSPAIALILLSYLFVVVDTIVPPNHNTWAKEDPRINSRCYRPIKEIVPTYVAKYWEQLPIKGEKK